MAGPHSPGLPCLMSIRWDSLLVRHLAEELNQTLTGSRLRALRFDARARDMVLFFRDRTLLWRLHPERGFPLLRDADQPDANDLTLKARLRRVYAPIDERIVIFEFLEERQGRGVHELIVELLGNQLNALVAEGKERRLRHVLRRRGGRRPMTVGIPYTPPPPTGRVGVDGMLSEEEWGRSVGLEASRADTVAIARTIAWTSPLNAESFLSDGEYALWAKVASGRVELRPVLMKSERGLQPYPIALPGRRVREVESLMAAFGACEQEHTLAGDPTPAPGIGPELTALVEDTLSHHERRVVRLQAELDQRENPTELRAIGDLILARYAEIPSGADRVSLLDFEGASIEIMLDPALPIHENASRHYDRAFRSERTAERIPALLAKAEEDRERSHTLLRRVLAGELDPETVRQALPKSPVRRIKGDTPPSLPYRTFRSSGGLEIRVGRGARHNDDLTFHHSAPNDIWLHARHLAGAHVILRWPGPGAPPARDLQEAAGLAALHSKARTSSSAPVDWTVRKYVRKPRRAAAGSVVPDRVKTLFVSPDPGLLESLMEGA